MRVDVGKEDRANAVSDEIDQMQAHPVLIREAIGGQPDYLAVVRHPDDQGPPKRASENRYNTTKRRKIASVDAGPEERKPYEQGSIVEEGFMGAQPWSGVMLGPETGIEAFGSVSRDRRSPGNDRENRRARCMLVVSHDFNVSENRSKKTC